MKPRGLLIIFVTLALVIGVVFYNYWSFSCGRCTVTSFYSLSPPALILLGCNVIAFLVLCAVRSRSRRHISKQYCSCGSPLHRAWHYCPSCGAVCRQMQAT